MKDVVTEFGQEALRVALLVSTPVMVASLVVGLVTSLFQATTQIHEQTLAFVPKIVASFLALILFGPWMLERLVGFATTLLSSLPALIR